ncbi:uncharacterized protein LOC134252472 [Saccostrea cucullata]|uniref:uncharacterized protein LOC134252472 n=1 Tax=Saccostrea cuccullata TaxID=36930 RepID=UPI002ED2D940
MSEVVSKPESRSHSSAAGGSRHSAQEALQKSLNAVKVSRRDARKVERALEAESFHKWHEGCEVMQSRGVPMANISQFLDHLEASYEGIDMKTRQKMDGILYGDTWEYKIIEWKYNCNADSSARYGMIAFGKSPDKEFVDCMYVLYKLDIEISSGAMLTRRNNGTILGALAYTPVPGPMSSISVKNFQNFFRYKALQGFYKEGLIDHINDVPSIEDTN